MMQASRRGVWGLSLVASSLGVALARDARAERSVGTTAEVAEGTEGTEGDDEAPSATRSAKSLASLVVDGRVRALAGIERLGTVLEQDSGVVELESRVVPRLSMGSWRVRAPLELAHRESFGANFRESRGELRLQLIGRPARGVRVDVSLGARAAWRPAWPDPYQPESDGTLGATDRYSTWDRLASVEVAYRPERRHEVSLRYDGMLRDGREDPSFDPIEGAMHLTPSDRVEHEGRASYRYARKRYELELGARAVLEQWYFVFARDAGTGATHTGGDPTLPNPLQRLVTLAAEASGEARLGETSWWLGGGYELRQTTDRYQGYYSSLTHAPTVRARFIDKQGLELRARMGATLKTYGPDSYAPGPTHPALTSGERRWDRRWTLDTRASIPVGDDVRAVVDLGATVRRTNYPPYVPGAFPVGAAYDIDWNYDAWRFVAGAEFEL